MRLTTTYMGNLHWKFKLAGMASLNRILSTFAVNKYDRLPYKYKIKKKLVVPRGHPVGTKFLTIYLCIKKKQTVINTADCSSENSKHRLSFLLGFSCHFQFLV